MRSARSLHSKCIREISKSISEIRSATSECSNLSRSDGSGRGGLPRGGLIGGSQAVRSVLNGVNVRLYDPSSGAVERVQKVQAKAGSVSAADVGPAPPVEGSRTETEMVTDAVRDVEFVQESAPDGDYHSNSGSYDTIETHLSHARELCAGERVRVLTQVLAAGQ